MDRDAGTTGQRGTESLDVLQALPEGIARISRDEEVVFLNPAGEASLGLTPGEWRGRHLFELLKIYGGEGRTHPLDLAVVLDHLSTGRPWSRESAWIVRSDEREMPAAYIFAPILQGGKLTGTVFSFRDLTDRRRAERALQEARVEMAAAEKAEAVKGALLATVSRDVLAPLDVLVGAAERLAALEAPPVVGAEVETIRTSARSLRAVLGDLLDWARIESGCLEIAPLEFDLRAAICEVVDMARPTTRAKGLTLDVRFGTEEVHRVVGDPGRIRQIVARLLANAVRVTDKGLVTVRVEPTWQSRTDVMIRVAVSDSGVGAADREWTGARERMPGESGVGPLVPRNGLPLARRLVELMGGALGAETRAGEGSTHWFELKLALGGASPRSLRSADLRGLRALVVDSSESGCTVLARWLAEAGMRCTTTASGGQALRLLRSALEQWDPFRIVVLSAPLREMDAATLGDLVKGDPRLRETALVYLAAVGEAGDARRLESIGFAAYLVQPVAPEVLRNALSVVWGAKLTSSEAGLVTRHALADSRIVRLSPDEIRERSTRTPREDVTTPPRTSTKTV